jgi:uncharacterized protein (TIGR03083 family)
MEHLPHFRREIREFVTTVESVVDDVPLLPACPGWSMTNIVMHLGWVHRYVIDIIVNRRPVPPTNPDIAFLNLPPEHFTWPTDPDGGPHLGPLPRGMLTWFTEGADTLAELLATIDPSTAVGTWSVEQSVGFWLRMQAIEAAVHRWDAQTGTGTPAPIDTELAIDVIEQNFTVMVPARRGWRGAPEGHGETFRFHATDADRAWTVRFDGNTLTAADGPAQHEFAGSASDLALFLWHRVNSDQPGADTWFTLVPAE